MKINFLREFRKDLNIVIIDKLHKKEHKHSSSSYNKGIIWGLALIFYILAKPWYIYYKGKLERNYKIKKLKEKEMYSL
jgi:hypothetical protein